MKVLNLFFVVLFVFSAALQYNDPDPYLWMPIYLYGAILCYLAIKGAYNSKLYLAGLVVYVGYAAYLFFDGTGVLNWALAHQAESLVQTMKATKPWIEETREFFGLLLLILALGANMLWFRKQRKIKGEIALF
jgi:hypothetical protein